MITLETKENQYGEEIAISTIYFQDGKWFWETLNCENSQDLGSGTCRCVSHNPTTIDRISREKAKIQIGEHVAELTEEERKDLLDESKWARVQEVFSLLGFTWAELEAWALDCYRMGMNPLPTLRKHLDEICQVGFMYDQPGTGWDSEEPTLVCKLSEEDDCPLSVCLDFYS